MDYLEHADIVRHQSYETFCGEIGSQRRVLLTTKADMPYTDFSFKPEDILILGRESAGVPEHVHAEADAAVTVPMRPQARSLNVAVTAAMVLGEALRQCGRFS